VRRETSELISEVYTLDAYRNGLGCRMCRNVWVFPRSSMSMGGSFPPMRWSGKESGLGAL